MSRMLNAVEIPEERLTAQSKAGLIASVVVIVMFTALVAFAPSPNPGANSAPAITAAATAPAQE